MTTGMAAFLAATLVVMLTPGPSVLYVAVRTLEDGRAAGMTAVLGLESALVLHVTAAALGLAGLVTASDPVLAGIRYLGAAYLLLLALRRTRDVVTGPATRPRPGPHTRGRTYREAFLVDALNPQTTLFLIAFLPQFIDPARGLPATQLLAMGVCVVAMASACDTAWVLAVAALRRRRTTRPVPGTGPSRAAQWAPTCVYGGLAVATVVG